MSEPTTWRALADDAQEQLRAAGVVGPAGDVRRILEQAGDFEPGEYELRLDEQPPTRAIPYVQTMVTRRAAGEPLQYALGAWSFRTLDLMVDRRVLIPRPETEIVVDVVLAELDRMRHDRDRRLRVADLGTGSGAIALSIAAERSGVDVVATDVSVDALAVARANLAGIGVRAANVQLRQGDWFEALEDPATAHPDSRLFDIIVSNPPYVAADDELPAVVRDHEPIGALISGPTGFEDLELIARGAGRWLHDDGALIMELAPHQAASTGTVAYAAGFDDVSVIADLTGRDRVIVARRNADKPTV